METTANLDIRIEPDDFPPTEISFMGRTIRFGHWTIRFKNTKISSYIVESSAISLITAMIALFFLSAYPQYATLRDFEWVAAVWVSGTVWQVPVLLAGRPNLHVSDEMHSLLGISGSMSPSCT